MKVRIQRTDATQVEAAGYLSVDQYVTVVAPAAMIPRHRARSVRRTRLHRQQVTAADGMVEVTLVRSSRNRLGGGARARPAQAL